MNPPITPVLQIKDASKSFDALQVLIDVDLVGPPGSLFALLGASGSGKTTLLRAIAGFERLEAGEILLGGQVVDGSGTFVTPERRRVGYVPQDGSLFPHLSVEANVLFGLPRSQRASAKAEELLSKVGLSGFGSRRATELSGGQRQRVAIARALAMDPALILLDEPFSALDASLRSAVRDQVLGALHDYGATVVLVTHDQDEAMSVADRVAVLRAGRIVQEAAPDVLYRHPVDIELARFVGEATVLRGVKRGTHAISGLGPVPISRPEEVPDGEVDLLLRPEQLGLGPATGEHSFTVLRHRYHGHEAMTHVAGPDGVEIVVRHEPQTRPVPGDQVDVLVEGSAVAFAASPDGSSQC